MKRFRFRSARLGTFVTKLFAQQNPDTTVREEVKPLPNGRWSQQLEEVPRPQCQFCGAYVFYNSQECPSCHADLSEGENGVPA